MMQCSELLWSFSQLPDDYVVLDTETTGLFDDIGAPGIVTVGLVKVVGRKLVDGKEFLVRPYRSISKEAFSLHGIKEEGLNDCPEFGELWSEISSWLEGALVIIHNASFDWRLILDHVNRYDMNLPRVKGVFCSQKSAFTWALVSGLPVSNRGPSLDMLTSYFQVENLREAAGGSHGALLDAKQTAGVVEAMRELANAP